MRIQFWGTRGSIATPGSRTARYGGNTSCVEVRSARGTLAVLDCGTGAHALGQKLVARGANGLRGNLLISHTHWDHIQGIPFFEPLFVRGVGWHIFGPKGPNASFREVLAGQMEYNYFPVTLNECGARICYHDLVEGSFDIEDIKVSTRYLNHPVLTLAYRLEADGVTVVYACDHEPHSRMLALGEGEIRGQDLRHAEFFAGADLLIHDAQYTAEEYREKIGWGHSSVEYVVNLGRYAQVKRIALTHHDPLRDDPAVDRLIASIRQESSSLEVFAAFEGQVMELDEIPGKRPSSCREEFDAEKPIAPGIRQRPVLLSIVDKRVSTAVCKALRAEGICYEACSSIEEARIFLAKKNPWLTILEHNPPRLDGMEMYREILAQAGEGGQPLPTLIVAEQEEQCSGMVAGITMLGGAADWLLKPFTAAYIRTKLRTCLLRTACQSMKKDASRDNERAPTAMTIGDAKRAGENEAKESETNMHSDKSALLWMYGREIAPFDIPAFSSHVGEIIARATRTPQKGVARQQRINKAA